ncbi:MAG: hypothetical protein ACT4P3_00235 [Betaproteobacteria bacterium]
MSAGKIAIAALLPALIVSGRFAVPALAGHEIDLSWVFAILGFVATLLGSLAGALALRRRLALMPSLLVAVVGMVVAGILLAIFPTLPGWPIGSEAIAVVWIAISAALTAVLLYAASYTAGRGKDRA